METSRTSRGVKEVARSLNKQRRGRKGRRKNDWQTCLVGGGYGMS
jgi:hypothetical protein